MRYLFIFLLFTSTIISAQHELDLSIGAGLSQHKFGFFTEEAPTINLISYEAEFTWKYKKFGLGVNISLYNHTDVQYGSPDQLQLEFNEDISRIVYPEPWMQETKTISYSIPTLFIEYVPFTINHFELSASTGLSFLKGRNSITRLTAEGDKAPTVVAYQKGQRAEPAFMYAAVINYTKWENINIGVKLKYQDIVSIWSYMIFLETPLFKK